jgi:hypothetical protein
MNSRRFLPLFLVAALGFLGACGGGGSSTPPPPQAGSAPLSVTIKDMPPAGVTVLSFEITVTGAVLQPGNVSLVSTPIEIEVKQLEVETAFLNTVNVPAGTYNSLVLTVSNPELTIKNDTGQALTTPLGGCASGAVCEFEPNLSTSVTINFAQPITIQANTPAGLVIDANLNTLISGNVGLDLSAANGFTVQQLLGVGFPTGQLEDLELTGVVANKGTDQFTLQTHRGDFTVRVDGNTQFEDFDTEASCAVNNFTCVQNGQVVEVEIALMAGGMLVAKEVEFEDDAVDDELEGIVVAIDSASQFRMVVTRELRNIANIDVGNAATVALASSCGTGGCFRVDDGGLAVPAVPRTLFESSVDTSQLMPGQTVQVRRLGTSSGTSINTDRVRLRGTRFTATVASVTPPNFVVNGLPGLFTAQGVSQIQVQTSSQTGFDDVANVNSLATGNVVSLRGLLFKNTPDPILVAKKVRRR